jgi:hypothetical protein
MSEPGGFAGLTVPQGMSLAEYLQQEGITMSSGPLSETHETFESALARAELQQLQDDLHASVVVFEVTPARLTNVVKTVCGKALQPSQAIAALSLYRATVEEKLGLALREFVKQRFGDFVEHDSL